MLQNFMLIPILFAYLLDITYANGHKVSNRHKPRLAPKFVGKLVEGESVVKISPSLNSTDGDAPQLSGLICEYQLHSINNITIPFEVIVLNKKTGEAEILLKQDNSLTVCNNQTNYELFISAIDCGVSTKGNNKFFGQNRSKKSKLQISLLETNKHSPYFVNSFYSIEFEKVIEAGQKLVTLHALDNDCSLQYRSICKYEVAENMKAFFRVSSDGNLISRRRMNADEESLSLNVSVVAFDCGGRKSSPSVVSIFIHPPCQTGVTDVDTLVVVTPTNTDPIALASNINFNLCISRSEIVDLQAIITLNVVDIESITGCNRFSAINNKEFCNLRRDKMIKLLPTKSFFDLLSENPYLPYKHPVAKNPSVYSFNGIDQVYELKDAIAAELLSNHRLTNPFALHFRFVLHEPVLRNRKMVILSKTDKRGMSRSHFSIYVQNCHLMLLMRMEEGRKEDLNPAEWHWKLTNGKNCTNQWYDVVLNVTLPEPIMKLNGAYQLPFLIADDYPLHPYKGTTQWSIGAAWHGRYSRYEQFFQGELSSLHVYLDRFDDERILECFERCEEGISINNETSNKTSHSQYHIKLSSNGNHVDAFAEKLRKISYYNLKLLPDPGIRKILVETRIICMPTANLCPYSPSFTFSVSVLPPANPLIIISGPEELDPQLTNKTLQEFRPFKDFIISTQSGYSTLQQLSMLSWCHVNISGRNFEEKFSVLPTSLSQMSNLRIKENDEGVLVFGQGSFASYQSLIRSISFGSSVVLKHGYLFHIQCSSWFGNYRSNVHSLFIGLTKPSQTLYPADSPEEALISEKNPLPSPSSLRAVPSPLHVYLEEAGRMIHHGRNSLLPQTHSQIGDGVVAVVIGGCVGVLVLFVVVIATVRFNNCLSEGEELQVYNDVVKDDQHNANVLEDEMDWDDSAINITVNPMEAGGALDASDDDFSEIDDDGFISDRDSDDLVNSESTSKQSRGCESTNANKK